LAEIDKGDEKILKNSWPGKTTFVLNRKRGTKIFGVDKKTIALRVPNYELMNVLLSGLNRPLAETSVNISGEKAMTRINEMIRQFQNEKNQPDLILDAGNLKKSKPSTIIDLTKNKPKILR